MGSYSLDLPKWTLDIERCIFSGQVFRWRKTGEDACFGVDGSHWYDVQRQGSRVVIESNDLEDCFRSLFQLDLDLGQIQSRIVGQASELGPLMQEMRGLRLLRPSDPVEVFYSFLCSANNHLKRIMPMVERLAAHGPKMRGRDVHRFPGSETIAGLSEDELRRQGFGYRGASIPLAARDVLAKGGDEWIRSLSSRGYDVAHEELMSIHGIGPKLADCICLYGLHFGEAVPIDTHMWQAATRHFFPEFTDKPLTARRYREIGDFFRARFGELAGWAHLFLYYENMLNWRSRAS